MKKTTMVIPSGSSINMTQVKKIVFEKIDHVDTLIVSYPKCGRTWLRSIIGKYLILKYGIDDNLMLETEEATAASNLKRTIFTHDGAAMQDHLSYLELYYPRTHYAGKNVILLGRDLKDTMVSAYFQATKRAEVYTGTISEFIKTDQYGIRKLLAFYDVWTKYKSTPERYLYATYEDLHESPDIVVKKIFELMGEMDVDDALLKESLDYNSFENQKKREQEGEANSVITQPRNVSDPESFKARKGKVGGYKDYLTEEDEEFIDNWVKQFQFDFNQLQS